MPAISMPKGALAMLILRVLRSGPLHGYAIAQRIRQLSGDVLDSEEGSLYPAPQRILIQGWVLCRGPSFTLGAVAVLALGIGVNLAEFQIFDAMIFHRLSVREANSLFQFFRASKQGRSLGFPSAAVEFYREESSAFAWLVSED